MTDDRTMDSTMDATTPATGGEIATAPASGGGSDGPARNLGGQATDKLRAYADDGKTRATDALDGFAKMIDDAAGQVDEKLGAQFGGYARQASGAVSSLSESLRGKEVEDLVEDARVFVQKSPAVAIGIAAALGFALARVLRSGTDRA